MAVYALMPVFNRLALTRQALESLRAQRDVTVRPVVVDDGSTDGTAEFLRGQPDVIVLRGDGNLWWGGAMDLGLRHVRPLLQDGDYVLFVNNDTSFGPDFVAGLVAASRAHGMAAVGSIVRDADHPSRVLTIGARANLDKFQIHEIATDFDLDSLADPLARRQDVLAVDFLPGRGTLYPGEAIARAGAMRPRLLPHYRADYEFSDRVRRAGFPLVVALGCALLTHDVFGTEKKIPSFWQRNFGKGSPLNILHHYFFYSLVGSTSQRLTAIPRYWVERLTIACAPSIRRWTPILVRNVNRAGRGLKHIWRALAGRS